jgi:hypothetical protein
VENEIQSNDTPQSGGESTEPNIINPGAPDASNATPNPTNNGGEANKGLNPQPSVDVFEKRFKDMESKFTRTRQQEIAAQKANSELQRQIAEMSKAIQTLTKKPYSPADFVRDVQEKGVDAILPHVKEQMEALKAESMKELQARDSRIEMLELRDALNSRRADSDTYPDFRKLEDTMKAIWEAEDCPQELHDPKLSPSDVLDKLYQLAKSQHSTDAVKAAEKFGEAKANKQLAKEAATAVATGGKAAGTAIPDPQKMSTKQLRDLVAQMGGVVDRD